MRRNWPLVAAVVIVVLWYVRTLVAGWGPGFTLFLTSFGLPIAGVLVLYWAADRAWRRSRARRV